MGSQFLDVFGGTRGDNLRVAPVLSSRPLESDGATGGESEPHFVPRQRFCFLDGAKLGERFKDGACALAGHQIIEITDSVLTSTKAAHDFDSRDLRTSTQELPHL